MSDITSRPFRVDPEKACEACVFGRGEHAEWCEDRIAPDPINQQYNFVVVVDCHNEVMKSINTMGQARFLTSNGATLLES